jgi:hypothetical protein
MIWKRHLAYRGKMDAFMILVGKREGSKSAERTRRGGEDNINMVVKEENMDKVKWINLAQDRNKCLVLLNTVTNFRAP